VAGLKKKTGQIISYSKSGKQSTND